MFPSTGEVGALRRSLSLIPPPPQQISESVIVRPEVLAGDEDGLITLPELRLWYTPQANVSFDTVVTRVGKELRLRDHDDAIRTTSAFLAACALYMKELELESVLSAITHADLTQIVLFSIPIPPFCDCPRPVVWRA